MAAAAAAWFQRRYIRKAGRLNSGNRRNAVQEFSVNPIQPLQCPGPTSLIASSRFNANNQNAITRQRTGLTIELADTAREEARADEQHQRQRYLHYSSN